MSDDIYRKVDPEQPVPWWLVPVEEPLLTREEAANDPEVRAMVFRQWQRQYAPSTVYSQVSDDE